MPAERDRSDPPDVFAQLPSPKHLRSVLVGLVSYLKQQQTVSDSLERFARGFTTGPGKNAPSGPDVPATGEDVSAVGKDVPATREDVPATIDGVPATTKGVPAVDAGDALTRNYRRAYKLGWRDCTNVAAARKMRCYRRGKVWLPPWLVLEQLHRLKEDRLRGSHRTAPPKRTGSDNH